MDINDAIVAAAKPYLISEYQKIVNLRYREGLSFEEVSEKMNVSSDEAKTLYHRAEAAIIRMLESDPEHEFWADYLDELSDKPETRAIKKLRDSAIKCENDRKEALEELKQERIPTISDFDFSPRVYNAFRAHGFEDVTDIQNMTKREFLQTRNIGKKSLQEVIETLKAHGYDPQFD